MSNTEDNKLIASAIGLVWDENKSMWHFKQTDEYFGGSLMFDTSWAWIMIAVDVIEAFEDRNYAVFIGKTRTMFMDWDEQGILAEASGGKKLDCTYSCLVEFCRWYLDKNK